MKTPQGGMLCGTNVLRSRCLGGPKHVLIELAPGFAVVGRVDRVIEFVSLQSSLYSDTIECDSRH